MENRKTKIVLTLLSITAICSIAYLYLSHTNKNIIGKYTLTWTDYSHHFGQFNNKYIYDIRNFNLCLDPNGHYMITYYTCFVGDQGLSNYLSAGSYAIKTNTIILLDQWNQTKIKLQKYKGVLFVTKGYRFLLGQSFVKEKPKPVKKDISENLKIDLCCEDAWFFKYKTNRVHEKYDSIITISQKKRKSDPIIKFGTYQSTSECAMEFLNLLPNHTFEYQFTEPTVYPILYLQGSWKQVSNILVLSDSFVNNSYYLEYINDTLKSGLNIPGSSTVRGRYAYSQSFIFKNKYE